MPYIHEETVAGSTVIVRRYYSSRYHQSGRSKRANAEELSEAQALAKERHNALEITILLNANFDSSDYYITLTYREGERPETVKDAIKDRSNFISRLRGVYKKLGAPLKYIIVTEAGKRGALHHHIVLNNAGLPLSLIEYIWNKGRINTKPLDPDGEYSKLAAYMLKYRKYWKMAGGTGRMWTHSRNLYRPPTKRKIVRADRYYEKPREKKGYYVKGDSIEQGYTRFGWQYMRCIYVSLSPPKKHHIKMDEGYIQRLNKVIDQMERRAP